MNTKIALSLLTLGTIFIGFNPEIKAQSVDNIQLTQAKLSNIYSN